MSLKSVMLCKQISRVLLMMLILIHHTVGWSTIMLKKLYAWSSQGHRISTWRCIWHPLQDIHPSVSYKTSQNLNASGSLIVFNTTSFTHHDIVKIPLGGGNTQLKLKIMQMSKDGSHAVWTGLYADCIPLVGMSSLFSCLICNLILMPLIAVSTVQDHPELFSL